MLFQIKVAAHPAEDHRLRDWALLRPQSEVDMHHDQRNQSDAGQSVQHVHHSPGHVAEQIRIAGKKDGAHTRHHEHAGYDRRKTGDDNGAVVELVLQRILGEFVWRWLWLTGKSHHSSPCVPQINSIRPDRPEVHKEGRMDDVKEDGSSQHDPRDPVISHPWKLDANFRQEGGKQ